jgi:hypothetical protein
MKEIDEIENLFASNFGDFKETPPQVVKSQLDAKLFPSTGLISSKKSNWKWLLLLIPIIGLSTILFYNFQTTKATKTTINHNQINAKKEKNKTSENSISTTKTSASINSKPKKTSLTNTEKSSIQKSENKLNKLEKNHSIKPKNNNKLLSTTKNSKSLNPQLKQAETSETKTNQTLVSKVSNATQKKFTEKKLKENSTLKNESLLVHNFANINSTKSIIVDTENKTKSANTTAISDKLLVQKSLDKKEDTAELTYPKTDVVSSNDSIENVNENSTQKLDSTKTDNTDKKMVIEEVKPTNNKENNPLWSISFYGGIANGLNVINPASTLLKEKIGSNFNLEANYGFHPKMSVSTGLGLDIRSENYSKELINIDSVVSNYTVTYITDSMQNIVDSIVTYFYVDDTTFQIENQFISYTTFSIPLYFNYTFFTKNNWSGAISAGIRFNYFKTIINSTNTIIPSPILSNFGLQFQLRPQLSYNWSKLSIGVYGQFGYDAKQAATWPDFTRKRLNYGTGLVVRYGF